MHSSILFLLSFLMSHISDGFVTLGLQNSRKFCFTSSLFDKRFRRCNNVLNLDRSGRFISDITKERMKNGKITIKEIDRIFEPSKSELEKIQHPLSKGFVGVIVSLEGALVDAEVLYGYTWAVFASDIGLEAPNPIEVRDIIGLDFSGSILALGWNLDNKRLPYYEKRFFDIMKIMIDKVPFVRRPGSKELIQNIIQEKDKITVVTMLPRELATKLLRITEIAKIFEENNINPECLILPEQSSAGIVSGHTVFGQLMIRCCSIMEKPSIMTLLIDSNRRNILLAKRMGISCIALKGNAANVQYLRSADQVIDTLNAVKMKDIYKLVKKALKQEEGPDQQTAPSAVLNIVKLKPVSSAYSDDDKPPRDTFADEMGSDQL